MNETGARRGRTRGQAYRDLVARLREADIPTPELDARLLLAVAARVDEVALISDPDVPVSDDDLARLDELVRSRIDGVPVSRLLGSREFWGLEFELNAHTLDPRPDSEALVEAVLGRFEDRTAALRILDLGTGTGCLLLALLSEFTNAEGLGVDRSAEAIQAAGDNALRLGLAGRARFQAGDWGEGLTGPFDVIVSNPPYIASGDIAGLSREVREHDPLLALEGGPDGLDAYRRLAPDTARLLAPGGLAFWEFGIGQSADVALIAERAGLETVAICSDLAGIERLLIMKPAF